MINLNGQLLHQVARVSLVHVRTTAMKIIEKKKTNPIAERNIKWKEETKLKKKRSLKTCLRSLEEAASDFSQVQNRFATFVCNAFC